MKLENERKEFVYKYDFDCTNEEAEKIKKIGIERFMKDERAQIEYGVLAILNDTVKTLEERQTALSKKIEKKTKGAKNGSKNNNRK